MKVFKRFYYGLLMAGYFIAVISVPLWHAVLHLLTGKPYGSHLDKMWDFIDNYSNKNQLFKN